MSSRELHQDLVAKGTDETAEAEMDTRSWFIW